MDEQKNIERVLNMVYYICGCSDDEAELILEKCMIEVKRRKDVSNKTKGKHLIRE